MCRAGVAAAGWVPGRVWGEANRGYAPVREYALLLWKDLIAKPKPHPYSRRAFRGEG